MLQSREPGSLWPMRSDHGRKGSRFSLELAFHGVNEAIGKAGHWALFGEANKSQVNGPNIIENLSKASRLSAYSSSSKDNLGKTGVSRGLGATLARGEPQMDEKTRQGWQAEHHRGGEMVGGCVEDEAGGGSKRRRGGTEAEKGGRRRDAWGKGGARHWTTSSDVQRGVANKMECERRMRGESLE
eukprot:scaffold1301_cov363-Pavlova_lutheri.AAC.8